jgi:hypothetical protein
MDDSKLKELGRRVLRDAAAATEAGQYAAQIGSMLYNGLGAGCLAAGEKFLRERYERQVKKLTEIQGYLEGLASAEAQRKLGL